MIVPATIKYLHNHGVTCDSRSTKLQEIWNDCIESKDVPLDHIYKVRMTRDLVSQVNNLDEDVFHTNQKAYIRCTRRIAAANTLLVTGARLAAVEHAKGVLRIAKKYDYYDIQEQALSILYRHELFTDEDRYTIEYLSIRKTNKLLTDIRLDYKRAKAGEDVTPSKVDIPIYMGYYYKILFLKDQGYSEALEYFTGTRYEHIILNNILDYQIRTDQTIAALSTLQRIEAIAEKSNMNYTKTELLKIRIFMALGQFPKALVLADKLDTPDFIQQQTDTLQVETKLSNKIPCANLNYKGYLFTLVNTWASVIRGDVVNIQRVMKYCERNTLTPSQTYALKIMMRIPSIGIDRKADNYFNRCYPKVSGEEKFILDCALKSVDILN